MSKAVKVGIFLVIGVALFCLGLFLIGSSSNLFGSHFTVYAQFTNIDTLTSGSMVRVGGMDAGQVASIQVPKSPSAPFRLKLQVSKQFRALVREDSIATIETQGMVGNEYVEIAQGTAKVSECSGCTLESKQPMGMGALMRKGGELADQLQATIKDLRGRADTVMQNISGASAHADKLITAVQPNVIQMSRNANAIVAGIRQGKGAAGKLLTDKSVAVNVSTTLANAQQASANLKQTSRKIDSMVSTVQKNDLPPLNQTVKNAQAMTGQMNHAVGTALSKGNHSESTAQALNDTIHSAQNASTNMADDTDALKRNLFLRGFFHRRGYYTLQTLTPSKYAHSKFVRKPRARVWIPAAEMFQADAHGVQQLTDAGRAIIDRNMSKLVPYLPNNPIMVEGYATAGAADQQYVAARQRAVAVSQYLLARYHLKPEQVGVMPLGDRPPPHTGKTQWDGICLALVTYQK